MFINQTKSVMSNAIKRYALENEVNTNESQLLIFTKDDEGTPSYKVLKKYAPYKEVTFSEILNKKIDFLQREAIATPFIQQSIMRLSKEQNVSPTEINVMIHLTGDKDVKLFLYVGHKLIKELTFEYIFGEEENKQ